MSVEWVLAGSFGMRKTTLSFAAAHLIEPAQWVRWMWGDSWMGQARAAKSYLALLPSQRSKTRPDANGSLEVIHT